jgi:hypothetical protein
MPHHRTDVAAAFVMTAIVWASPAASQGVLRMAGSVVAVTPPGSVTIVHAVGGEEEAIEGRPLYPGDRFIFRSKSVLSTWLYDRPVDFKPGGSLSVPLRPVGRYRPKDESFLDRWRNFALRPRRGIPAFPFVQDPNQGPPAPVASEVLPTGRQHILATTREIALVWRSGPSGVRVAVAGQPALALNPTRSAWRMVPAPDASRFEVAASVLVWNVEVSPRAPRPDWQAEEADLSQEQRVVRALWILSDGPVDWRLFALSELAELANGGNFAAAQFWQAARSGELVEALQAAAP